MSGELSPREMLSSSRGTKPVQHLPFFAPSDLQIECSPRNKHEKQHQNMFANPNNGQEIAENTQQKNAYTHKQSVNDTLSEFSSVIDDNKHGQTHLHSHSVHLQAQSKQMYQQRDGYMATQPGESGAVDDRQPPGLSMHELGLQARESDDRSGPSSAVGASQSQEQQDALSRSFENGKIRRKRSQRATRGESSQISNIGKGLSKLRFQAQAQKSNNSAESDSQGKLISNFQPQASNVVQFANLLLSKHEESTNQREVMRTQSNSAQNSELPENFKTPIIKAAGRFDESSDLQEQSSLHQVQESSGQNDGQTQENITHNMSAQNQSTIDKYQHYSIDEPQVNDFNASHKTESSGQRSGDSGSPADSLPQQEHVSIIQNDITNGYQENSSQNLQEKSHKSEETDGQQMQMPSSILGNDETHMLRENHSYGRGDGQNTRTGGDNDTFEISMPESPNQKKMDRSAQEKSSIINENEASRALDKENNALSHQQELQPATESSSHEEVITGQQRIGLYSQMIPSNSTGRFVEQSPNARIQDLTDPQNQFKEQLQVIDEDAENSKMQVVVQQYELVLQQLNGQIQNLLVQNQQIENNQLQAELQLQQTQQQLQSRDQEIQGLHAQLSAEKAESEMKLAQVFEGNTNVTNAISQELGDTKQTLIDLETQAKQMSLVIQQQNEKVATLEHTVAVKDQQVQKLRTDNQNMFIDLKALAQTEERIQRELLEHRRNRAEIEQQNEQLREQCQRQQTQIRQLLSENDIVKRDSNSRQEQLPMMIRDIESLQEENRILMQKLQSAEQHLASAIQERDIKARDARGLQAELSRANNVIGNMQAKIEELQSQRNSFGGGFERGPPPNRRVMHNNEMNPRNSNEPAQQISWLSNQEQRNSNEPQQIAWLSNQDSNDNSNQQPAQWQKRQSTSPFMRENKSKTPHPIPQHGMEREGASSPVKGRHDPNMPQYARQTIQANKPAAQLATMSMHELLQHKQVLEQEYQKIPITVSGKSIQVRRRKEELEFELDNLEKHIYRARQLKGSQGM